MSNLVRRSLSSTTMSAATTTPDVKPIPVLVSGATELIGQWVVDFLKPEYETIHFTLAKAIRAELPVLLSGTAPPPPRPSSSSSSSPSSSPSSSFTASSTLGTGNWAAGPPRALLLGGAYGDADVAALRALVADAPLRIPWLRVDNSLTVDAPVTRTPAEPEARAYSLQLARRWKAALERLRGEGRLEGEGEGEGGVWMV